MLISHLKKHQFKENTTTEQEVWRLKAYTLRIIAKACGIMEETPGTLLKQNTLAYNCLLFALAPKGSTDLHMLDATSSTGTSGCLISPKDLSFGKH